MKFETSIGCYGYQNGNQTVTDEGGCITNICKICSEEGRGEETLESTVFTAKYMSKDKKDCE